MMFHKYLFILALGLPSFVIGQSSELKPKPSAAQVSPADKMQRIENSYLRKSSPIRKRIESETDVDKKKALEDQSNQMKQQASKKVFDLAIKNPEAEGISKPLSWAVNYYGLSREDEKTAIDLLIKRDGDFQSMYGLLVIMTKKIDNPDLDQFRTIIKNAAVERVRQDATLRLASIYDNDATWSRECHKEFINVEEALTLYKKLVAWPNIAESNPETLKQAKRRIFVHESLGIGMVSPNIVGRDHDDKEFQLNDYREKVVLLDFWGMW